MSRIDKATNLMDFRAMAKSALPAPLFHYIDGAADDEWTLRRNTDAFMDYELMPSYLRDVASVDMSTNVLGADIDMPLFLSPTGMSRLFHHEKEAAVAKAAAKFGTMYTLSTVGTTNIEDVAAVCDGPKMFQIYVFKDRELTKEFLQRCKAAGYTSLCLTVDLPVAGYREKDLIWGMSMPPKFTMKSLASFAAHPGWAFNLAKNPGFELANIAHRAEALKGQGVGLMEYVNQQLDQSVSWDDAAWMIEEWGGPFAIKGVQTADDAKRCVEIGASAIMISNHGGRQLDSAPAPVDCVAPIRDAIGDRLELIVDGGVRRGTHVLKALALGANAVSFGRPYLYGLAAAGQEGVERVLTLIRAEIARDMRLIGCSNIKDLPRSAVQHRLK